MHYESFENFSHKSNEIYQNGKRHLRSIRKIHSIKCQTTISQRETKWDCEIFMVNKWREKRIKKDKRKDGLENIQINGLIQT